MTDHPSQTANTSSNRAAAPDTSDPKTSGPRRAYLCNFCQRSFKRSDTRRLHYSRCPARISTGKNIPPAAQKGRKPRACDPCAQRKRACNEETPCSQCLSRNIACTRNRADSAKSADALNGVLAKRPGQSESFQQSSALGQESMGFNSAREGTTEDAFQADFTSLGPDDVEATWFSEPTSDFGTGQLGLVPWSNLIPHRTIESSCRSIPRTLRPAIELPGLSPLTFLFNITTTTGIASSFNFAFFNSKHKSRKRVESSANSSPQGSSPDIQTRIGFGDERGQHAFESASYFEYDGDINDISFSSTPSSSTGTDSGLNRYDHAPIDGGFRGPFQYSNFSSPSGGQMEGFGGGYQQPEHNTVPASTGTMELLADPLFPRTREILLAFQALASNDKRFAGSVPQLVNLATSPKKTQATRCLQFFSPHNLRNFVNIFWDDWYPHCPIVHRPSFNIQTTPIPLLLAITLLGASLSPTEKDNEAAKEWLEWAEEICFREASAQQKASGSSSPTLDKIEKPTALQAAVLMTVLQNWEGGPDAKTRVRRQRSSTTLDLARSVGFNRATHDNGKAWATDFFDWSYFIVVEELIRCFTFAFLIDASFVIFNNSPSKLLLQELSFDLVCPAACFNAETPQLCLFELKRQCPAGSLRTRLSFHETVQILHQNSFDEETSATFLGLDSLNLFSIVTAIYINISQQFTSLFGPSSMHSLIPSIHNSLSTWSLLWNSRSDLSTIQSQESARTVEPWKRIGFYKHADEYRVLSLGILHLLEAAQHRSGRRLDRLLPKFDETSMEQVTKLLQTLRY